MDPSQSHMLSRSLAKTIKGKEAVSMPAITCSHARRYSTALRTRVGRRPISSGSAKGGQHWSMNSRAGGGMFV